MGHAYAVICASNQNRSMEAHAALQKRGVSVDSYGTNSMVKIPGPAADRPNVYSFGTTYDAMLADLRAKDAALYTQNGMLQMLERNKRVKERPQRFQDAPLVPGAHGAPGYDLLITCEERCFEAVCEDLAQRGIVRGSRRVHVVNFEVKDTPEDALVGAREIAAFVALIEAESDLDGSFDRVLSHFMQGPQCTHAVQHALLFY